MFVLEPVCSVYVLEQRCITLAVNYTCCSGLEQMYLFEKFSTDSGSFQKAKAVFMCTVLASAKCFLTIVKQKRGGCF